ncbi:MAG: type II secretion system protein [Planctomycetes bacterium]|nr:type II secretion system protein [Planctomycetota bacterium]
MERPGHGSGRYLDKGGFTLIEVLFALGILALGGASLIALFTHNLREAKRAREEIIINIIQRDVSIRNQLAAYAAPASGWDFYTNRDQWVIDDITAYDQMAQDDSRKWENIPAYRGYYFWVDVDDAERGGAPWSDDPNTHGFYLYDTQFVDWDGYGWIDLNNDGVLDGGEDYGVPAPSHKIEYDSRGMRQYMMRMRGIIAWDLKVSDPSIVKAKILNGERIAKYHIFYFSVYNPDTQKH